VVETNQIPELMSIEQLAQRLGITVRHVRRLVAERRVPYLKVAGSSGSTPVRSRHGSIAGGAHW
jgi:excisionase family DNA binding protein